MARLVSFVILVAILIGIGFLFLEVMWAFLLPLFMAALLGVVFQPLYEWILARVKNYRYVASAMTTMVILLVVLVPAGFVATLAVLEGLSIFDRLEIASVPAKITELRKQFELEIPQANDLNQIELSIERWYEQQQNGDIPQYTVARIDNLVKRIDSLEVFLSGMTSPEDGGNALNSKPYLAGLKSALEDLKKSDRETVEADDALAACQANFKNFKREFLGGTYQAWLKELANPSDSQVKSIRSSLLGLANAGDDQQQARALSRGSSLVAIGGNTLAKGVKVVAGVVIMVIALFFFLAEGSRMIDGIVRLSPLEERYLREMIQEFERVSRAVVAATLLAAVAQGILAGIGFYYIAGLSESVALLTILTMLLAMVPFMGAAAVWIPVCIYVYVSEDKPGAAIALAIYGTLVISTADNIIKPFVLHGQSNLHPLLALLSVLGGITTLGPIGIMVGPMAVVFLQTLLKILQREMMSMDTANRVPLAAWASGLTRKASGQEEGDLPPIDSGNEPSAPSAGEVPQPPPASSGDANKNRKKRRK